MTEKRKTYLCVGGPRAGERHAARAERGFACPILPPPGMRQRDPAPQPVPAVEHVYYREDVFHTPQGDVSMWVPEGQTPLETLEALLHAYMMHKSSQNRLRWQGNQLLWGHIKVGEVLEENYPYRGGWHAYYNTGRWSNPYAHIRDCPTMEAAQRAVEDKLMELGHEG